MSDMVSMQFTVIRADAGDLAPSQRKRLVFHVKDNHTSRALIDVGSDMCLNGYDDMRIPENRNYPDDFTGFVKYCMVNNVIVWTEDIDGDEGWQRVEIDLNDFFEPAEEFGDPSFIEIGLMVFRPHPDGNHVRGVTIFVDDVFLENFEGHNAIRNGDFETPLTVGSATTPMSTQAEDWYTIEESEFDATGGPFNHITQSVRTYLLQGIDCFNEAVSEYGPCNNGWMELNELGGVRATDESRSGNYAYKGYVHPFWAMDYFNCESTYPFTKMQYYTGLTYHAGFYKAVRQEFSRDPSLIPIAAHNNFKLQPNPSNGGAEVLVTLEKETKGKYTVTVISPDGKTVYEAQATGMIHVIKNNFKPGVYYVRINDGKKMMTNKMVVIK
ncbi:MAG TPA: T9SS type A sorting domain-containing protein [Bacteroidia bacterium]|nr:T9SS type A sorting domain-containing protein [Bacteroidia bacterium]HNU33433.1 T9SS type A sorting domain-containing protein [Bacteroidia bacterium]